MLECVMFWSMMVFVYLLLLLVAMFFWFCFRSRIVFERCYLSQHLFWRFIPILPLQKRRKRER